jgi:hypothetical protein
MTLTEKQVAFCQQFSHTLVWAARKGFRPVYAEGFRPAWVAKEYARRGVGIVNSLHRKKLAHDIWLLDAEGNILWDDPAYGVIADYWCELDDENCWGGDFGNRDIYHYSRTHGGIK